MHAAVKGAGVVHEQDRGKPFPSFNSHGGT